MHYLEVVLGNELVDVIPFCSDWCHQQYCRAHDMKYEGWNGCHEGSDSAEYCASCLEEIHGNRYNV